MVSFGKKSEKEGLKGKGDRQRYLVLHNDDVNTFDHVIDTLCVVCNHDEIQAEQCAVITHFKGSCEIKEGSIEDLLSLKEELIHRELSVTID
ncbi:ATP-dependent Clp protease adaptor ClpS [Marinilabiliaceae bacterium JC017]|nr:ATP-dependent Clp protease adaptor ClpS [Marinilabiliaceae bacterium JC017]